MNKKFGYLPFTNTEKYILFYIEIALAILVNNYGNVQKNNVNCTQLNYLKGNSINESDIPENLLNGKY